jgi:hypothetical protein
MRWLALLLAAALAMPAAAQEQKPKKPAGKPAAQRQAHAKPTPQQLRRFNELEKKEQPVKKAKPR